MLLPLLPMRTLSRSLPVALMRTAEQRQVLDRANGMQRIGKTEADLGLNRVGAVAAGLVHHVAGIVNHIGVVASAAKHRVGASPTIKRIVAAEAGEHVVAEVAIKVSLNSEPVTFSKSSQWSIPP